MTMRLALVANAGAVRWSFADPDSWGGSEEVLVELARALARAGHDVTVFWAGAAGLDGAPSAPAQVTYLPYAAAADAGRFDVAIYHKCPEMVGRIAAARAVLWTVEERLVDAAPFAAIVVPSQFLARVFRGGAPRSVPLLRVIPYGIEPEDPDAAAVPRDPARVLWTASPDRGLLPFLTTCWPAVVAAVPTARLEITYGFELFRACGGDPALEAAIQQAAAAQAASIASMGRRSRATLACAYAAAGVWAYYCTGGEYYCLAAVKAQRAGCVPVVRPWGALHETVRAGLTATTPAAFTEALVAALDPARQAAERTRVRALPPPPSWDAVAAEWTALLADLPGPVARPHPLALVPPTPPLCPPTGALGTAAVATLLGPWLEAIQPRRLWVDPALAPAIRGTTSALAAADAVILGWSLEDDPTPPEEQLAAHAAAGLRDGTPVAVLASAGPWRAAARTRTLATAELRALLGRLPDFAVHGATVDAEGSVLRCATLRWAAAALGRRDPQRARHRAAPRETLSVCLMVRDAAAILRHTLDAVALHADEVVVVDTGSVDGTPDVADRFGRDTGLPVTVVAGTSPRWCYDCSAEHPVGAFLPGHRLAGFETARNESIARAQGDWVLWLDADEELIEKSPRALAKYLRPNAFAGYSLPQHHFSADPPDATKTDYPVRLFRRVPDGSAPGLLPYGPDAWPTYHPGLTVRFAGIVHEHPGLAPAYTEGLGPVIILSDVALAHSGYYLEWRRRRRFERNWPLMVADRQKYPDRRLGRFLWLRDLTHHARYLTEQAGGHPPVEALQCALAVCEEFETVFLGTADPFTPEAHAYYTQCATLLGRGPRYQLQLRAEWPEVFGDLVVEKRWDGRFRDYADLQRHVAGCASEFSVFEGPHR
jgi:glycosyltransferase involved in cell wall biosynthesis